MLHHRRAALPAAVLGMLCLAQAGCHSLNPSTRTGDRPAAPAAAAAVRPGKPLAWSVSSPSQPQGGMSGRGVVGPDGALEMGPYGTVPVAGQTLAKAESAAERQVRQYVRDAKVELRLAAPADESAVRPAAQWSSAGPARPAVVNGWQQTRRPGPAAAVAWRGVAAPAGGLRLVSGQPEPAPEGPALFPAAVPDGPAAGKEPPPDRGPPRAAEELATPRPVPEVAAAVGPLGDPHLAHGGPVPRECQRVSLPPYVIGPPDILLVESVSGLLTQKVEGQHLVRPDGTVGLGIYGSVYVAGMTLDQARVALARAIYARLDPEKVKFEKVVENLSVDVLAYNSKVYYVITDGGGYGEQVTRLPITGSETVLDAISLNMVRSGVNGLPPVASKRHIWVARPNCHGKDVILPVDWIGITQRGETATNYQVLPGDRVYVKADKWRTFNATVDKIVSPFERMLGVTLLGSETVNSIRSGSSGAAVP